MNKDVNDDPTSAEMISVSSRRYRALADGTFVNQHPPNQDKSMDEIWTLQDTISELFPLEVGQTYQVAIVVSYTTFEVLLTLITAPGSTCNTLSQKEVFLE